MHAALPISKDLRLVHRWQWRSAFGNQGTIVRLGELLVQRGLVTSEQVEDALFAQRQFGGRVGTNLIEMGAITDDDLARCLSEQLHVPYARPEALSSIPKEVIARLPRKVAEKYRIVPLRYQNGELYLCMADPQNFSKLDELRFALNCPLHTYVVTEVTMNYALERYYGIRREVRLRDLSGGVRELATPAPSPAYDRRITQSLPVFGEASQASATVLDELANVMTHDDVVKAMFRYFTDVFDEVLILAVANRRPTVVRAGSKTRGREVRGVAPMAISDGSLLQGVLAKPQALHQAVLADPELKRLCAAIGFPMSNHSFVPVFEGNRPGYLVIGQGRDERYLVKSFAGIKTFVAKASHALRIVALRREITAA
jgi:hypothetical protein